MLSFSSLVIALARPQIGSKLEEVKRQGVDVMIALDVSNSMNGTISVPVVWNVANRPFTGLSISFRVTASDSLFLQGRHTYSFPLRPIMVQQNFFFPRLVQVWYPHRELPLEVPLRSR
jgi:hypothetical protein